VAATSINAELLRSIVVEQRNLSDRPVDDNFAEAAFWEDLVAHAPFEPLPVTERLVLRTVLYGELFMILGHLISYRQP